MFLSPLKEKSMRGNVGWRSVHFKLSGRWEGPTEQDLAPQETYSSKDSSKLPGYSIEWCLRPVATKVYKASEVPELKILSLILGFFKKRAEERKGKFFILKMCSLIKERSGDELSQFSLFGKRQE